MADLNQTDIDVRLQLTGCEFSELANTFANDLKYGRKCATTNQRNLLLLNAYIELIECLNVETLAVGSVFIQSLVLNDVTDLLINGVSIIGGPYTVISTNTNLTMSALTNYINTNTSYTAVYNGGKLAINITGTCENFTITATTTKESVITTENGTGGICTTNNCITEIELQGVMDNISKLTKICFQPIGFEYTPNT